MGMQNALLSRRSLLVQWAIVAIVVSLSVSLAGAQTTAKRTEAPVADDFQKYPGLTQEFEKLFSKMQAQIQAPPLRSKSNLLPLLPDSTLFYAAFPNYGNEAHQALAIFNRELQESAVLRDWWTHGEIAKSGPLVELGVEKVYEFSQYLGDEIVVSGGPGGSGDGMAIVAEVRKPGLKLFLQQTLQMIPNSSKPAIRVLDLQELSAATDEPSEHSLVVLVRPDFVIAAPSVKELHRVNDLIETRRGGFSATAFGNRLQQAYASGVSALGGADLENLLKQIPHGSAGNEEIVARTGFGDLKYLVWEHKSMVGQPSSQTEVSFTGPRHGAASWLAAPAEMNSLDFVSPKAVIAMTLVLKNWSEIFDDIQALATTSNPNAMMSLEQMQQAMNLNLKNDLLRYLDGEVTIEIESVAPPNPAWRAILRVNNPEKLQQTMDKLLATSPFPAKQREENGINFHILQIPSGNKLMEVAYAFANGYLVIGSGADSVAEAIQLHQSGNSLKQAPRLVAALPPGHPSGASALFYEDPLAIAALGLKDAPPEIADTLSRLQQGALQPIVICGYGEEAAIRIASGNGGADMGAILIGAAIAIPNLLRARMAANESAALGTVRTLNVAQVTYSTTYPQKGYARDMASFGFDPRGQQFVSSRHAGLMTVEELVNSTCVAGSWCTRSGYKFAIKAVCGQSTCKDFAITATPASSNTGKRSFCSTSDGVVRYQLGEPLSDALSVEQCRAWEPLR